MKVEFRFNGESSLILTPENEKEKTFIRIFTELPSKDLRISSSDVPPESLKIIAP